MQINKQLVVEEQLRRDAREAAQHEVQGFIFHDKKDYH